MRSYRTCSLSAQSAPALIRVLISLFATILGASGVVAQQQRDANIALVFEVNGVIGPAAADYVIRSLNDAADRGARLVILSMDTPGGLDTSMRDIIRAILASTVPVATFVAPSGARAASAGTYILLASHIAAMAPSTNLGAATPVQISGGGLPTGRPDDREKDDSERAPQSASEAKAINDAVAYIRGLAELRGRNADWAERAVREAATLTSTQALSDNVIDFIAADTDEVLAKANGETVEVAGNDVRLATADIATETVEPDWRTQLLAVITNPNVALLLMTIGVYGLIFELMSPGALYPGIFGTIALLLGFYGLAVLPVNYAGIALILLGIALVTAEAFAPSFGILGLGGAFAIGIGAVLMLDTDIPGLDVGWPVIGAIVGASLALSLLVLPMAIAAHRRPVATGQEELIGAPGKVTDWTGKRGHVFVHGERWNAVSAESLREGEAVRVSAIDGLTLKVEPAEPRKYEGG